MQKIEIIQEPTITKPFVIVNKPAGLPSAPLKANDSENALCLAAELFPEIKNINGRKQIEFGLMHRLDTATNGLLLIAATQDFYNFMQSEQKAGRFEKIYKAVCNINEKNAELLGGFPSAIINSVKEETFTVSSFFRNFGEGLKEVRPVTEASGKAALKKLKSNKLYTTQISVEKIDSKNAQCLCRISEGYRHQVRCHLAWNGLPVCGDSLYNAEYKNQEEKLEFSAVQIKFTNPVTNKIETYKL